MTTPMYRARYLASAAILAALAACAPAAERGEATNSPKNQAGSDSATLLDSSDAGQHSGEDISAEGKLSDVTTNGIADATPFKTDGGDTLPDALPNTEPDAAADALATSDTADVLLLSDAIGDAGTSDADTSDAGPNDTTASGTKDVGAAGGADANPWLNSATWPPHAVAILNKGKCELLPPPFTTGGAYFFCRQDWEQCTLGNHNLHAPCGWVQCCNNAVGTPVPGCPTQLKTFTGYFPVMMCPPMLSRATFKSKLVPNPVGTKPHCCPQFEFKWP